jgi:hypothetical protein
MCASNELLTIPGRGEKDEPFKIGDVLTIYEAAMVYTGRHPYPYFFDVKGRGIKEHLEFLRLGLAQSSPKKRVRAQRSWDIYCEIAKRIEEQRIRPVKRAYDPQGRLDLRLTLIRTADVLEIANDRCERPKYLRSLMIDAANLGTPRLAHKEAIHKTRPSRQRAQKALNEIYQTGIPNQADEPNSVLCRKVAKLLKDRGQPDVSNATILRAAGRRVS